MKRGDILSTGELSTATLETIRVSGLDESACSKPQLRACVDALAAAKGVASHRWLATLAELWLQQAILLGEQQGKGPWTDEQFAVWLEAARHAYAYLFFTARTTAERTFEDRQTQVRDYYNYAVQETSTALFQRLTKDVPPPADHTLLQRVAGWTLYGDMGGVRLPEGVPMPQELIPATSLSFAGVRSVYRRDGLGAELVASMPDRTTDTPGAAAPLLEDTTSSLERMRYQRAKRASFSEMPSPVLTVLFRFTGDDLAAVLKTRAVTVAVYDPYRRTEVRLHDQDVPLAANFTAGYGLWLAKSGFATQSLRSLLGREQGIDRTHLYMMQPYDPDRRIIVTLHGLASSPEAWVNVANELLGDETLRAQFQIWQVYYPTNLPIALSHATIRRTLDEALRRLDPQGKARASRDIVLIGHSMGGVISRLMVSSAGDRLWSMLEADRRVDPQRLKEVRPRLEPMLGFTPMPNVSRAIFVAAPHRGTPIAANRVSRWLSNLVRLPAALLQELEDISETLAGDTAAHGGSGGARKPLYVPNSIDNLRDTDPFVQAAADLPISSRVTIHSIIARSNPAVALADSDDGLVPYRSAHLDGAASEKVIESGHSVQQTAPAILEIRRILLEDLARRRAIASVSAD